MKSKKNFSILYALGNPQDIFLEREPIDTSCCDFKSGESAGASVALSAGTSHPDNANTLVGKIMDTSVEPIEFPSHLEQAACRDSSELFTGHPRLNKVVMRSLARAKKVCDACPVKVECLEYAERNVDFESDNPLTLYGGKTVEELIKNS